MKFSRRCLVALAFACGLFAAPLQAATHYKVIVIAGQSNCGDWSYNGGTGLSPEVSAWINSSACDALILTSGYADVSGVGSETLQTMYQQSRYPHTWNGVTIAEGYAQCVAYYADKYYKALDPEAVIVVVKKHQPATSIDYWSAAGRSTNDFSANGSSSPYYYPEGLGHQALFARIQRVKALLAGQDYVGAGFIWYQGEGNCNTDNPRYFEMLKDLVDGAKLVPDPVQPTWGDDPAITATNGIRQELNSPDMPFVVARVSSEFTAWGTSTNKDWTPQRERCRRDLVNVTRELTPAAFIDVDDRPVKDDYHYAASERNIMGQRFGEALVKLWGAPVIRPETPAFGGPTLEVSLSAPLANGATIYYTLDGSTPGAGSNVYSAPFTIDRSLTVKAVAYVGGVTGPVVEKRYTLLAPLPAETPTLTAAGMRVRANSYASAAAFPGFENTPAPSTTTQARISRDLRNLGVILCTGYVDIPQDGVYEFKGRSDSDYLTRADYRLTINDVPVDRWVSLKAGLHPFRFEWMNYASGKVIYLWIKGGPYTGFTQVPISALVYEAVSGTTPASFEPSRSLVAIPAAAGTGETVFVASSVATWAASSSQGWLTVSPAGGAYNEMLTLTSQANSTGSPRTATITLSGSGATSRSIIVTQAAGDAAPMEAVIASAADGSTTTLPVTAAGAWKIRHESSPWFDVDPAAGTGNTTVTIRARKNFLTSERAAWLQVDTGGASAQRVKVRQAGDSLYLSPSALSTTLIGQTASDGISPPIYQLDFVDIRTNTDWTAMTSDSWLRLLKSSTQTQSGSGDGRIYFLTTGANTTASSRQATVTVTATGLPAQTITVVQPGTDPFLAAMPPAVTLNRGDAGVFHVASSQPSWSAASDQSWLAVTQATETHRYMLSATPNTAGASRTANVTITSPPAAPVVVAVTQQAAGKLFQTSPSAAAVGYSAAQGTCVLVDSDESWSVTSSSAAWLAASREDFVLPQVSEPLLREHTPDLRPVTDRKYQRLLLAVTGANPSNTSRQALVTLTSSSGATIQTIVTQAADPNVLAITSQPASTSITTGQTAVLTIGAAGPGQLAYQWYQGASPNTAAPIAGATGASFTTPALSADTSYWVRVTDGTGASMNSQTATVSVVAVVIPTARVVDIDFGATPTTGNWNNVTTVASGLRVANAVDSAGLTTNMTATLAAGFGLSSSGVNSAGLFPATANQDAFFTGASPVAVTLGGLDNAKTYTITCFASTTLASGQRTTAFTVGGTTQTLEPSGNVNTAKTFIGVSPASGSIVVGVGPQSPATVGIINALEVIVRGGQEITFPPLPSKAPGDADFSPEATISSGQTIAYTSSNLAVATIVAGQIHIVGAGTSTITAAQAGNASYEPAASVQRTLTVSAASPYEQWTAGFTWPNGSNTSATGDADGDGLANLMEYALGTSPVSAGVNGQPFIGVDGQQHLTFTFTRDSALSSLTYEVEGSNDLSGWITIARSSAGGATTAVNSGSTVVETSAGGSRVHVVVTDAAAPAARRFLRLLVIAN